MGDVFARCWRATTGDDPRICTARSHDHEVDRDPGLDSENPVRSGGWFGEPGDHSRLATADRVARIALAWLRT